MKHLSIQVDLEESCAPLRPATSRHRLLPDGTALHNRLLAALPIADYGRLLSHLGMRVVRTGETLQDDATRMTDVYFPNWGVHSVTVGMRSGALFEVATVGREGMLGVGAFFGDRTGTGRAFQQVPNGPLPSIRLSHCGQRGGARDG
jgi:hypothetical protein